MDGQIVRLKACVIAAACLSMGSFLVAPRLAQANVSYYSLFKDAHYTQTSSAEPTAPDYYYFSAPLYVQNVGDITGATITTPVTGAINSLTELGATSDGIEWQYQPSSFSTQAGLDASYPNGIYTYTADTASGSYSVPLALSGDFYSPTVPYLTGSSYTALQNANAGQQTTITWNPISLSSGANTDFVYLGLFDSTTNSALSIGGNLGTSTTSLVIPAGTFSPGDNYELNLYFTERSQNTPTGLPGVFGGATSLAGYDRQTSVSFTAVPEPPVWILLIGAIGTLTFLRGARMKRRTADNAGGSKQL